MPLPFSAHASTSSFNPAGTSSFGRVQGTAVARSSGLVAAAALGPLPIGDSNGTAANASSSSGTSTSSNTTAAGRNVLPWYAGTVAIFLQSRDSQWTFRQRLHPPVAVRQELEARHLAGSLHPDEKFGAALAADGDRGRVVVGCPGASSGSGRVYVFDQPGGHTFVLSATLEPTDMLLDGNSNGGHPVLFGQSVALTFAVPGQCWAEPAGENALVAQSLDAWSPEAGPREMERRQRAGRVLAIGAPGALGSKGAAAVQVEAIAARGTWSQITQSTLYSDPDGTAGDWLGASVDVLGSVLAAGAPGHRQIESTGLNATSSTTTNSRRTGAALVFTRGDPGGKGAIGAGRPHRLQHAESLHGAMVGASVSLVAGHADPRGARWERNATTSDRRYEVIVGGGGSHAGALFGPPRRLLNGTLTSVSLWSSDGGGMRVYTCREQRSAQKWGASSACSFLR